jgi:hypothetical protein
MTIDDRARLIFQYFKKYNYSVKATGEVITFSGLYAADKGQAAAVTFYTFFSEFCATAHDLTKTPLSKHSKTNCV